MRDSHKSFQSCKDEKANTYDKMAVDVNMDGEIKLFTVLPALRLWFINAYHSPTHTHSCTQFVFDIKHNLFMSSLKQYKTTDSNLDDKQEQTYVFKCECVDALHVYIFTDFLVQNNWICIGVRCLSKKFPRKRVIKNNFSLTTAWMCHV